MYNPKNRDMETLKMQFAILKGKGKTNLDISKELKVSPQTLSKWAKSLPVSHYITIRNEMQKRLTAMMKNKATPVIDIYNLSNALAGIEKTISKYYKVAENRIKSVSIQSNKV